MHNTDAFHSYTYTAFCMHTYQVRRHDAIRNTRLADKNTVRGFPTRERRGHEIDVSVKIDNRAGDRRERQGYNGWHSERWRG